jgi:hypothetical protein
MAGKLVSGGYEVFVCGGGPGVEPRGLPIQFLYIEPNNQPMRDTWRPWIGPRVLILLPPTGHVSTSLIRQHQPMKSVPRHPPAMSSYGWYGPATSPYGLYGQVQSASKIFACLAWRTDRDIFSIRTPFEKVNIPPESGRRDGRNGTVFVAFRAL